MNILEHLFCGLGHNVYNVDNSVDNLKTGIWACAKGHGQAFASGFVDYVEKSSGPGRDAVVAVGNL